MHNNSREALPEKAYPDESTLIEAYRRLAGFNALNDNPHPGLSY